MKRTPVKDLYHTHTDDDSRFMDYGNGYTEQWEFTEASECSECGKTFTSCSGEEQHRDMDDDSDCEGYVSADGPMMNYFYPCQIDDLEEAALKISHLPLCVVSLTEENETGLALTGGGMDLSWSICEAYMVLGYLPPAFCRDLPQFAGKKLTANAKWIIAGCKAACKSQVARSRDQINRLTHLRKEMATA